MPHPPPAMPQEIQYWAGVIMRNACRKDDSRGGIRQCANSECALSHFLASLLSIRAVPLLKAGSLAMALSILHALSSRTLSLTYVCSALRPVGNVPARVRKVPSLSQGQVLRRGLSVHGSLRDTAFDVRPSTVTTTRTSTPKALLHRTYACMRYGRSWTGQRVLRAHGCGRCRRGTSMARRYDTCRDGCRYFTARRASAWSWSRDAGARTRTGVQCTRSSGGRDCYRSTGHGRIGFHGH